MDRGVRRHIKVRKKHGLPSRFEKGGDINRSSYESIHPWFSDLCVHLLNHDSHLFVPHLVAPLGLIDLPGISWSKHVAA